MAKVSITEYTDPACPFAFSAEPSRWRLRWRFGDQLAFSEHMVVLSEARPEDPTTGFTPERAVQAWAGLSARFGMPMFDEPKAAMAATVDACRAVVAARLHAPEQQWPLLRALRHRNFSGPALLDDPQTIRGAAEDAGIDPEQLEAWMAEEETERVLREDMALARDPSEPALAMPQKLASTPDGGWRYTCPSYEMRVDGVGSFSAPGMQSSLTYETALANLAPELEARPDAEDVSEVLAWAGVPLATQEVAEVCGLSRDAAREQLEAAGAVEERVGADGFWTAAA